MSVVVVGGGIAGLWTLDALRKNGIDARLFTLTPLGTGQTIQSQGILHGGGKYLHDPWMAFHSPVLAIRSLGLAREASDQPARWMESLSGRGAPDLHAATLRGAECYLWLSKHHAGGRLAGIRWLDLAGRLGIIAARPRRLDRAAWPHPLDDTAAAVYAMAEPVVDIGSVIRALAEPNRDRIHLCDTGITLTPESGNWRIAMPWAQVTASRVILTAGAGNQTLLESAGLMGTRMQLRPLCMFLVRGSLPLLNGHCSTLSPKPLMTITSAKTDDGSVVWQVGGGIAETHAGNPDDTTAIRDAAGLLRRELPSLDHDRLEWAVYRANRAEPASGRGAIPGSAYVDEPSPGLIVGWPVKLVLAPLLADRIVERVIRRYNQDMGTASSGIDLPFPGYAKAPWEEAAWSPAR